MEYWELVDTNGSKTGTVVLRTDRIVLPKNECVPSVVVWIRNSNGEFLISKRDATKPNSPNMWEATGGSVISGETFLDAAIRETEEELGIKLSPNNYSVYKSYTFPRSNGLGDCYIRTFVFDFDVCIEQIRLRPSETIDAMWASKEKIKEMILKNEFIDYDYIDDFFARY